MAFGAVAHAELDAEVDADADEQHGERDRDQVERADQPQADRGGHRQAEEMLTSTATMIRAEPSASHRMPIRNAERDQRVDLPVLLERAEFLVLDRDRAGQPHPRAVVGRELEVGRGLADRFGRGGARLELREIEDRLDLDEPPQIAGSRLPCDSPVRATRSSPAVRPRRLPASSRPSSAAASSRRACTFCAAARRGRTSAPAPGRAASGRCSAPETAPAPGRIGWRSLSLLVRGEQEARYAGRTRSR